MGLDIYQLHHLLAGQYIYGVANVLQSNDVARRSYDVICLLQKKILLLDITQSAQQISLPFPPIPIHCLPFEFL